MQQPVAKNSCLPCVFVIENTIISYTVITAKMHGIDKTHISSETNKQNHLELAVYFCYGVENIFKMLRWTDELEMK